ncbi:hypothetical protein DdX_22097 [Ditylenchus destructor]|uniref:Uncharacterized protein n=1 Tax=Ditylenchus destructor TaxID=166010 RepID=A0AAD4MIK2_9BILA|nr:hypothetical protein DdX_22097 [Ditylenchus destructor]
MGGSWWTRIASVVPLIALVAGLITISVMQDEDRASELAEAKTPPTEPSSIECDAAPLPLEQPPPVAPLPAGAFIWAGAFAVAAFGLTLACAQPPSETASKATGNPPSSTSASASSPKAVAPTKPLWNELTAEQQQALKPLIRTGTR